MILGLSGRAGELPSCAPTEPDVLAITPSLIVMCDENHLSGYEVGDIVYWASRHNFVIMYDQNGERISNLQKVGRIHSGTEIFKHIGNISVRFELNDDRVRQ